MKEKDCPIFIDQLVYKKEQECTNYVDSIVYAIEQTAIYCRIKGAQFFKELNIGVTLEQFIALDAISFNPDICQRDLSKLILKDRSNTGRLLGILEETGFIERKVETKGKRLVRKIYITEKGKDLIEKNQERLKVAFADVFSNISDDEFFTMRQTLRKMKESLSKFTVIQI